MTIVTDFISISSNEFDLESLISIECWIFLSSCFLFAIDEFQSIQRDVERFFHSYSSLILDIKCPFRLVRSFNQPKLCPNASWNPNAVTFANSTTVGPNPIALFITNKNTIVTARRDNGQIPIWHSSDALDPTTIIPANLIGSLSIFVTGDDQIFVDYGDNSSRVERWTLNGTRISSSTFLCGQCHGVFVDVNNNLYCSVPERHQVMRQSLSDPSTGITIAAGTGCAGATEQMLQYPAGIFVTIDFDLYVADHKNDRVQLFQWGEKNGITVAGNGSSGAIDLRRPRGVVVDGDGYVFIVDAGNNRLVGSGPNGFRCLVGCSKSPGLGSDQLFWPWTMGFDIDGNIFVSDEFNHRIQKFLLSSNSCGE